MSNLYSDRDMTGWDLSDRKDMNGLTIHGLCLSNETPDAQVLPPNLKGTTFIYCNMDNVFIPPGNTLINCSNRKFKAQEDGEDWLVHPVTKNAVEPLNLDAAIKDGKNCDPTKIKPKADASVKVG